MISDYTGKARVEEGINYYKELAILSQDLQQEEELAHELRSMSHDDFCETHYWHLVREFIKSRALYRCQLCNNGKNLVVHHRTYKIKGREHRHLEDLCCICSHCHHLFHFKNNPTNKPRLDHSKTPEKQHEDNKSYWVKKIMEYKTPNGGFTNAQIKALGQECYSGWLMRAAKAGLDATTWNHFVEVSQEEFKKPRYQKKSSS